MNQHVIFSWPSSAVCWWCITLAPSTEEPGSAPTTGAAGGLRDGRVPPVSSAAWWLKGPVLLSLPQAAHPSLPLDKLVRYLITELNIKFSIYIQPGIHWAPFMCSDSSILSLQGPHNAPGSALLSVVGQTGVSWHESLQGDKRSCHVLSSLCPSQPERCFQRQPGSHPRTGGIPSLLCSIPSHVPKSVPSPLSCPNLPEDVLETPLWYSWKSDLKGVFYTLRVHIVWIQIISKMMDV